MTENAKTAAGAVWSLVLGILGLTCIGPLGAIPAIICGHVTRNKIKESTGALKGEGVALAGLILGYVGIGLMIVMIPFYAALLLPAIAKARDRAQNVQCVNNLNNIESAKTTIAEEKQYKDGAIIPKGDFNAHFENGVSSFVCPDGGSYRIQAVGQEPTCSIHGTKEEAMQRR